SPAVRRYDGCGNGTSAVRNAAAAACARTAAPRDRRATIAPDVVAYFPLGGVALSCPRPQERRKERAGSVHPDPPFPFFGGGRGGSVDGLERGRGPAGTAGRVGPTVSPLSAGRPVGRGGDGRFAAALGTVVAAGGVCPGATVGSAGRLQALDGGAAGGRADDVERARRDRGRAHGQGSDPGAQPRSARHAGAGGGVGRAGVGARRRADAGGGGAAAGPAQELGVPAAG